MTGKAQPVFGLHAVVLDSWTPSKSRHLPSPWFGCLMRRLTLLLGVFCAAGCGRISEGPPTFPASGTLLVDGTPAEHAQVILHPANGSNFDQRGVRPTGIVAADGSFRLTTYQPADGAPAGSYVVTVYWAENPESLEPSPDRLKGRFLDPRESKLRVEIRDGENRLQPLNITTQ